MKLAQMERIAHRLGRAEVASKLDNGHWEDVAELAQILTAAQPWKPRMEQLRSQGPVNVGGGLAGLEQTPTDVNGATVTGSATEQNLLQIAGGGNGLLPIRQNVQSSTLFHLFAQGTSTTAATPGTYTFSGRIGPAPTNASPAFGTVPSASFTPVASGTALPWWLSGFVLTRGAGSANTAVGAFFWNHASTGTTTGGPSLATSTGNFGGVSAAFDSTGATCALWIGVTHATSTTNTWIPQAVAFGSWN